LFVVIAVARIRFLLVLLLRLEAVATPLLIVCDTFLLLLLLSPITPVIMGCRFLFFFLHLTQRTEFHLWFSLAGCRRRENIFFLLVGIRRTVDKLNGLVTLRLTDSARLFDSPDVKYASEGRKKPLRSAIG